MTKIFTLILLPFLCQAGNIGRRDIRDVFFKLKTEDKSLQPIFKTKDKQTQNVGKIALFGEFDIKWTSGCSHILYNRRVIADKDSMTANFNMEALYNEIVKVNGNKRKNFSSIKGYDMKIEAAFIKLDTLKLYRELSEVDEFKNYNGSTKGGILISDKYSISYKQNTNDTEDFLIAFEEIPSIEHKSKFKLLDYLFFKMESEQDLITSNCRFNDKYDKEIVAIYTSKNDNEEAKIIKAWRFNRQTLKIEVVDIEKVKYKVADKNLFFWDK